MQANPDYHLALERDFSTLYDDSATTLDMVLRHAKQKKYTTHKKAKDGSH